MLMTELKYSVLQYKCIIKPLKLKKKMQVVTVESQDESRGIISAKTRLFSITIFFSSANIFYDNNYNKNFVLFCCDNRQ